MQTLTHTNTHTLLLGSAHTHSHVRTRTQRSRQDHPRAEWRRERRGASHGRCVLHPRRPTGAHDKDPGTASVSLRPTPTRHFCRSVGPTTTRTKAQKRGTVHTRRGTLVPGPRDQGGRVINFVSPIRCQTVTLLQWPCDRCHGHCGYPG